MTKPPLTVRARTDATPHASKPSGSEVGRVSAAIAAAGFEAIEPAGLARLIASGATICPADFEGQSRKLEDWRAQQLWFVDVDNDTQGRALREVRAAHRALRYGLPLLMAYQSFSGDPSAGIDHEGEGPAEAERYRLVFARRDVVTDRAEAERFGNLLLHAYPEADQTTCQLNRMFYGTNKEVEVNPLWMT